MMPGHSSYRLVAPHSLVVQLIVNGACSLCALQSSTVCLEPRHAAQVQLPAPARALQKVVGNPSVRLGAVAALALVAVWGYQASGSASGADLTNALEVRPVTILLKAMSTLDGLSTHGSTRRP